MNNTLIIGLNRKAIDLYESIKNYPALGYKIIGFVSLKEARTDLTKKITFLGKFDTITKNIWQYNIKTILIAIDPDQHSYLKQIICICSKSNIKYQIVSDVYDTAYGNVIKDIYRDLYQYRELDLRRSVDLIGAFFLLIVLFPLFIIIASAIKIESRGSIFFSQPRAGIKGKPFRIYKFRTMVKGEEQESDTEPALKNDLHTTNVGNFLKQTSIDELPQLLNIFKGDMSFIGPSPDRPFFVESFRQQIPFYNNRLKIKPGTIGWAQVNWKFDESIEDIREKLAFDLFYINNRTISLDIKIIFMTINAVLPRNKM